MLTMRSKLYFVMLPLIIILIQGCQSSYYSVRYRNVSDNLIAEGKGIWGDRLLIIGRVTPKGSGLSNGVFDYPVPKKPGARWINTSGEEVEFYVELDHDLFPQIGKLEDYEFIFELRQNDIRQVELVVNDRSNPRTKKRKVMLYCAESEGCRFNSPYTTDSFYSPEQQAEIEQRKKVIEALNLPPSKESEYFSTTTSSFSVDVGPLQGNRYILQYRYFIHVLIRKKLSPSNYIEVEYQNPDGSDPIIVSNNVSVLNRALFNSNPRGYIFSSPMVSGIKPNTNYLITIRLYESRKKEILLGTHKQLINSRYYQN